MINTIVPSPPTGYASSTAAASPGAMTTFSPDALVEYCQSQLGGIDSDIQTQMNAQQKALREREAIQGAQSVLESYGTDGPTSGPDFQKCLDALDKAATSLSNTDPGDPLIGKLRDMATNITSTYKFTAGKPLDPSQQAMLSDLQARVARSSASSPLAVGQGSLDQQSIDLLNSQTVGTVGAPPKDDQWKSTTDDLDNLVSDVKDGAEVQMLQLQDLVSQRQQAVEACNGMVSKTDQTLEDQSKAIGQG